MRIVVGLISAAIALAMAVLAGFILLVALNGFSQSQGEPGLAVFVVTAIVNIILSGVVGVKSFGRFTTSGKWPRWLAGLIAVIVAAVLSAVVLVLAFVASVVITSAIAR